MHTINEINCFKILPIIKNVGNEFYFNREKMFHVVEHSHVQVGNFNLRLKQGKMYLYATVVAILLLQC